MVFIDSPIGPPLINLFHDDVNFGVGILPALVFFGPKVFLILSGVILLKVESRGWLLFGVVLLAVSLFVFILWINGLFFAYIKMSHGPPGPII